MPLIAVTRARAWPGESEDLAVDVAIGAAAFFPIVVLVIVLGRPEIAGGGDARRHPVALGVQLGDELFGRLLLPLVQEKNLRPVLGADVGPLTVELGGIVQGEEFADQVLVADPGRIERHLDGLGVAGAARAHLLVGRLAEVAAGVADGGGQHAARRLQIVLGPPETPRCENGGLGALAVGGNEIHGDGVDAMAGVLGAEALAQENVAQVGAASGADDLGAQAVRVASTRDGAGDLLVEARPTAARVELVRRPVQRRAAALADVGSPLLEIMKAAAEGPLGPAADDDPLLLARQFLIDVHFAPAS